MIETEEQTYISGETGSVIGGNVAELLDIEYLIPLRSLVQCIEGVCRLHFVFDYYGIRYYLLLDRSEHLECCEENTRLNEVADCFKDKVCTENAIVKCLDLFWPVVADDSISRDGKTTKRPTLEDRFKEKSTVKIQLVTNGDGKLLRAVHTEPCLYPAREPIRNPCPSNIRVFQMEDIEFLEEISHNVFKAKLDDVMVIVKVAPRDSMQAEIEILMKASHHPSVISPLLGVVDAGQGCIDKFIIPFIIGRQLSRVRKASLEQKSAWKRQISDAISFLHDSGIAWSDGSIWNVMVDAESGRAILIDFGEGSCEGCERFEEKAFEAMKRRDLEVLSDISDYIDNLPIQKA